MDKPNEFEKAASEQSQQSTLKSIWAMLMEYKKWWMIPIVVILILMSALIFLGGSAAAPFIYSLF